MLFYIVFFFFKQKTAYEMRISDWSSDVCSSDLLVILHRLPSVLRELSGVDRARLAAGDVQAERDGAGVQGSRRDRQPAELSAPAARLTTGAPAPAHAARARRRGGWPVAPGRPRS